jgi:holin-like protein
MNNNIREMTRKLPGKFEMLRLTSIVFQRSRWLQVGSLIAIWWLCEITVRALSLPVPGSILGMTVLLMLLLSGYLRSTWVRRGASRLLDHMVLFFVPAVMALLNHKELLSLIGLKILMVIVVSTLAVMVATAFVVEICFHWRQDDPQ